MPPAMTDPAITGATHGWAAVGVGFVRAAAPIAAAAPSATDVLAILPSCLRAFDVEKAPHTIANRNILLIRGFDS